jgi:coenzyme F420-reducing hydrogenase beta subunit
MKNHVLSNHIIEQECTGCSICAVVCPFNAIKIELSNDGFYEPVIDEQLCEDCGLCIKTCYKFDENIKKTENKKLTTYSAINKNKKELLTSTSGGVSIELMKSCIDNGYNVLGVSYDYNKNIALTKISSSVDKLEEFKGSKYFQSYTLDAFKEVLKDNRKQKYAVFATPCQIYAISKYVDLHKLKDKWLFIDIFCYGCPSLNLWNKYLEYNKNKLPKKKIDKIQFRSKPYGWHQFNITFVSDDKFHHSLRINDPFYVIFFKKNALNEACYTCKLRSTIAYTDIRMGDFWGEEYSQNIEGVSAVVIYTDKGRKLFDKVKDRFEIKNHALSEVIPFQSYGRKHKLRKEKRRHTLDLLSSEMSMEQIIKRI